MTDEPTKKELVDALAAAQATIAQLQAAPKVVPQPAVQAVPYKGHVRAKEACYVNDTLYQEGDVFYHEVDALWDDAPFEAVTVVGTKDDGKPVTEPNPEAPTPIPFRLRRRTSEELDRRAAEPQRADKW